MTARRAHYHVREGDAVRPAVYRWRPKAERALVRAYFEDAVRRNRPAEPGWWRVVDCNRPDCWETR